MFGLKKRSKWIGAVTILALSTIVLGACGTSKSSKEKDPTLIWYLANTPQKGTKDVNDKLNEVLKEKKAGYQVSMEFIDVGDYDKKLNIINNSGEEFDIAFTSGWAGNFAKIGTYKDVTDLLPKFAPETNELLSEETIKGTSQNGKLYAVPGVNGQGYKTNAHYLIFNKELVEKYDIPYEKIHSLADAEPYLEMIKEKEPEYIPLNYDKATSVYIPYEIIQRPYAVNYEKGSTEVVNIYEQKDTIEQLKLLRKYYQAGYIPEDAAVKSPDPKAKFFATTGEGFPGADVVWTNGFGTEVVSTPILKPLVSNASSRGSMLSISARSKHPEESMKFINLINTDKEIRNLVGYGIEGTDYKKADDNEIEILPDAKYEVAQFNFGSNVVAYNLKGSLDYSTPEFKEIISDYNKTAVTSPILGFTYDSSKLGTESAGISSVLNEYQFALNVGSVDVDKQLEQMNKKFKEAGGDRVKEEIQSQIDDWKKTQK